MITGISTVGVALAATGVFGCDFDISCRAKQPCEAVSGGLTFDVQQDSLRLSENGVDGLEHSAIWPAQISQQDDVLTVDYSNDGTRRRLMLSTPGVSRLSALNSQGEETSYLTGTCHREAD
ncbi:hypothetical protein KO498_11035 [Lentibacter algarum]|uniref:hypothetical protein n=1 Tax=Lentibacter algarum TaxID=576131 RepID=UPI001C072644|nr:hypothetical protein [Lentibacter algarum]MBU2982341.1 hypothetical protein [Lentibacter algarum]